MRPVLQRASAVTASTTLRLFRDESWLVISRQGGLEIFALVAGTGREEDEEEHKGSYKPRLRPRWSREADPRQGGVVALLGLHEDEENTRGVALLVVFASMTFELLAPTSQTSRGDPGTDSPNAVEVVLRGHLAGPHHDADVQAFLHGASSCGASGGVSEGDGAARSGNLRRCLDQLTVAEPVRVLPGLPWRQEQEKHDSSRLHRSSSSGTDGPGCWVVGLSAWEGVVSVLRFWRHTNSPKNVASISTWTHRFDHFQCPSDWTGG